MASLNFLYPHKQEKTGGQAQPTMPTMSRRSRMSIRNVFAAVVATAGLALGATANATNLSFTGTFSKDGDVQLFNFTVSTASMV